MQPNSPNFGNKLAQKATQAAPLNHGAVSANQMKGPKNLMHVGQQSSPFDKSQNPQPNGGSVSRQEVIQLIQQLVPPLIAQAVAQAMSQDQQQDQQQEQNESPDGQNAQPSPFGS